MGFALVALLGLWVYKAGLVCGRYPIYNVADYGAVGNGHIDDTRAFSKAWEAACEDRNYPTFLVPSGRRKTFHLGNIVFSGPCKSAKIHVQVSGNIVAPNWFWTRNTQQTWIIFTNIDGLTVDGHGQINGRGSIWWPCVTNKRCSSAPYSIQFMHCNGLRLSGIYFKDSPGKHVAIHKSQGVKIHGLTITSPADSPNTDGILIFESQHVDISASTIGVGDDCIAIGPGSFDVNISRITCGPGHGISIGSLGANSMVENVRVSNCDIFQTMTGVRIKTWQGGSGHARNILYEHIEFSSVGVPIVIDQYYCPSGKCTNKTSAVTVSDVTYNDLHGTSVDEVAISLACSESTSCSHIVLNNVNFTVGDAQHPADAYCLNAFGKMAGEVLPRVPCLE